MGHTKYIFVSGGVISGIGKGITAASISMLLKARGYKVFPVKCENYLNVDSGTINPIEHGDPFLCFDGLEADQDLGNYERYTNQEVGRQNFMTMGQLYQTVINKERRMEYGGEDVEPIPHVVNEIIDRLKTAADQHKPDFMVVELGGTVGEYENNNGLYYEAARIIGQEEQVTHIHVTYVPVPEHLGEPKTKPAQFGIKQLMSMGILPNFIVIRSEKPIDEQRKYKFALKFNINAGHIISNENLESIYDVPIHLNEEKLDEKILEFFGMEKNKLDIQKWIDFANRVKSEKNKEINIAIVGKYFGTGKSSLLDSYIALIEAVKHAAAHNSQKVNFLFINSEKEEDSLDKTLSKADGIIVPIGWGSRGVPGKIKAIQYARENKIPYLGLCYGMQLACIEFARNVVGLKGADTEEIDPKAKHKIIHSIPFDPKYQVIKGDGVSMRLGTYDCKVKENTVVSEVYKKHNGFKKGTENIVEERHRHRFEFNNDYKAQLEKAGLVFSGTSPDEFFVEFIELPKDVHPFFVATQGHPEYQSRPIQPQPLFIEFLKASENN